MTHFEEIKQMNVDELAAVINDSGDDICFETCTKSTGDKFLCPYGEDVDLSQCIGCVKKWLESEVGDKK